MLKDKLKNLLPDKIFLEILYYKQFGKKLDLKNPKTFNEKLQWLKLYNRKPIYTTMVDKYLVKEYVSNIIGKEYIIPTIGIYNKFDEIDFNKLPDKFVIKTTHDSGGIVICKSKNSFDKNYAKTLINKHLKTNFYYQGREWPYKNVVPRIIVEEYVQDNTSNDLYDYKFFCFNGQCKCYKVDFERFIDHHANYYDKYNKLLMVGEKKYPPLYEKDIYHTKNIEKMKELAEALSKEEPFLRCDFYDADGKIYFGEITFFPSSGFGNFTSNAFDLELGKWLKLPEELEGG